jgi:hypothetical protein
MKLTSLFVLFLVFAISPATISGAKLPFMEDDYGKALTQAKQRNLPIFVECWAPW